MSDDSSAETIPLVSREQAENAFRAAMLLFVGGKRRYSVEQLAKGIGLPKKNGKQVTKPIYDFMSYPSDHPDQRPLHMGLQFSITKFLGSDFTNEWLALCTQGAFDLPEDEPDPGELAAEVSESNAKVTRMAADRNLNNDCPQELRSTGSNLMTHGAHLVAIGSRVRRRA